MSKTLTPLDLNDPVQLEEAERMMLQIVTPRINAVFALDYWLAEFTYIIRALDKEREGFGYGTKEAKRLRKAMVYVKKARERVIAVYGKKVRTR